MILEGLVTTIGKEGKIHVAPMGPRVDSSMSHLLLRPYSTSQTCQNLLQHPEGVFHVTDDVTLIARGAIGLMDSPPNMPASLVKGFILNESCRAYEFKVVNADTSEDRVRLECEVVKVHRQRDFFGFNRNLELQYRGRFDATGRGEPPPNNTRDLYEAMLLVAKTQQGPVDQKSSIGCSIKWRE